MKNLIKWIILGVLIVAGFAMTLFIKTPQEITSMLVNASSELKIFSAFVHLLFLATIVMGLVIKKCRNLLFFSFISFLSLSATVIGAIYGLFPNVIIFAAFFVLIVHAYFTNKLFFELQNISLINKIFGIIALIIGFWYLHWVDDPVWLNALLYSPLGVVNCPTMITICGFLCLTKKPRSIMLEATVALVTLYFGFFGIFRLGAYVDVSLIACALFLIFRIGSYLSFEDRFEQK